MLLAHLTVALSTESINLGSHSGQQLFGGHRGYPRPLKRLNLFALPKNLAAHVLYLAPNIDRKTGHRIKYAKVDADTGEEVSNEDIMKGYKVDTDTYIEVSKDELDNIALESTRTIDIIVPKSSIDPRYLIRPYYLVPDGKVGHDAFAVIRESDYHRNL